MNRDQVNTDHIQVEADEVRANEAYVDAIDQAIKNKNNKRIAKVEKAWAEWRKNG